MRRALPALLVALAAIVAVVALRACAGASTPARPMAPAVRPGLSEADEHAATLAAARAEEASATPAPPAPEPPSAGATRGLVIDRRTGEPVNDVLVRLRAVDGGSASARTGTDGRFEARAIESAKPLEVTVLDDDHELESEAVGEPTDLLVRVEIGPTYVLRDFRAAVLDEWRAQVIERRPETPVAGRLRIFESSLELMPDEDDDLRWSRVRVRPGPIPGSATRASSTSRKRATSRSCASSETERRAARAPARRASAARSACTSSRPTPSARRATSSGA